MADGSPGASVLATDRTYAELLLSELHFSPTQPRKLPRDTPELLAKAVHDITVTLEVLDGEAVCDKGIIDPLRVRRRAAGGFEIVDGERRWWAGKLAGLLRCTCEIVVLSDEQVAEEQLVKNGSRVDLTPLEEAEAFAALMSTFGRSVDEVAANVGKPVRLVRQRLQLRNLVPELAELLAKKRISLEFALKAAARDDKSQAKVVQEIARRRVEEEGAEALTTRELNWVIRQMELRLADGGFPLDDVTLVPSAGSCLTCPKRSGVQAELFADGVEDADQCSDSGCFDSKQKAQVNRLEEKAKAARIPFVKGAEAKKLFPYGDQLAHDSKLVDLDKPCQLVKAPEVVHVDEKSGTKTTTWIQPTWREVFGDKLPAITMVVVDKEGKAHELLDSKLAATVLKTTEHAKAGAELERSNKAREFVEQRLAPKKPGVLDKYELERMTKDAARREGLGAIAGKAAKRKPDLKFWRMLAGLCVRIGIDAGSDVAERRGLFKPDPKAKRQDDDEALFAYIASEKDEAQIRGLVVELLASINEYGPKGETGIDVAARFYDVDLVVISRAAAVKIKAEALEKANAKKKKPVKGAAAKPVAGKGTKATAKASPTPAKKAKSAKDSKAPKPPVDEDLAEGAGTCRVCNCDDMHACEGGCAWADLEQTLCSVCAAFCDAVTELLANTAGGASRTYITEVLDSQFSEDENFSGAVVDQVLADLVARKTILLAGQKYVLVGSDAKASLTEGELRADKLIAHLLLLCKGDGRTFAQLKLGSKEYSAEEVGACLAGLQKGGKMREAGKKWQAITKSP